MPNGRSDTICNGSRNETFQDVIDARVSRRKFIGGGVATAAALSIGGIGALIEAVPLSAHSRHGRGRPLLGFQGIPVSSADTLEVPPGYTAKVLISWGDPVSNGPAFQPDAGNTARDQAMQWGMHNDGMVYFPIHGSSHGLLVQNNEYTDDVLLFPDGIANWNQEKTNKSINAHGVSVIEIARRRKRRHGRWGRDDDRNWWDRHDGRHGDDDNDGYEYGDWHVVRPSRYARRITAKTQMFMGGPVAQWDEPTADPRLITGADRTGRRVLGTINNCAMGFTPWGTYLACEENFNGYFRKNGPQTPLERRYGITAAGAGYLWHTTDLRFRADEEPNEANRFGWVVEFDPFNPQSTPVKRTALGRLKHEGAWVQEARDGRVVVYMGDDEQFEYIYRYVSKRPWKHAVRRGIHPLDEGTLYVAKFHPTHGEWLPLTPENPALAGWTLNDILINTRGAGDAVGATKMDRPEWIDTFPETLSVVGTLTNNTARGVPGTNPRTGLPNSPTDAANPRSPNPYGHIIRWSYAKDFTEPMFQWDIFALCGDPANPAHESTIVGDKFGSPDGLYVAPSGRLWIQTDVSGSTIDTGRICRVRQQPDVVRRSGEPEVRRFLVGPKQCEVTGVFVTPDESTMFVGIQHPGEAPTGVERSGQSEAFQFVAGRERRRTSTLVLRRDHERRRRTDRELKRRGRRWTLAWRRSPLQSVSTPSRNRRYTPL